MEYQYSRLLDPSEYETDGLCEGLLVRKHSVPDLEEIGAFKAQEDWRDLVGPITTFRGSLSPEHNFVAVTMPECVPDRLEIVSYANEFGFLHDDIMNDEAMNAFHEGSQNGKIDVLKSGKRHMQAKILNTMMSIDRPCALVVMRAWTIFLERGSGRQHDRQFQTLAEYLPYRCNDAGQTIWCALVTFGCAITMPEEEMDMCAELIKPGFTAACLTNDLFSYDKENEAAQAAGLGSLVNALCVLMHEHNVSLEVAKDMCRARIKDEVAKYTRIVKETMSRNDISSGAKRFVELMQYTVSGTVVWTLECPRYHKNVQYNERQLLRMKDGVAKHPATHQWASQKNNTASYSQSISIANQKEKMDVFPDSCTSSDEGTRQSSPPTDATYPTDSANSLWYGFIEGRDWDIGKLSHGGALPTLREEFILEPYHYVSSMPSKGIRDMVIDGIKFWLSVPPQSTSIIRNVVNAIHTSSIMLDDVQDGSQLRRGNPSAHIIFGEAQTINAATFQYVQATAEIRRLTNPLCLDIYIEELRSLFLGQSIELHWTTSLQCPSVTEYLQMVDGSRSWFRLLFHVAETGGLFRLLARLMAAESPHEDQADMERLCRLLGRFYQIRDDYQNLVSEEYTAQKGFCEDLDEGKFSLPLIHALAHTDKAVHIQGLLRERHRKGRFTKEQKQYILTHIRGAGSLAYVLQLLRALYGEVEAEVRRLESVFGQENHEMRLMLALVRL
ncbi:terpenoid synthase [Xylaria bambusicola]|uniref:terpenoid synthase n=1 Tax=Xylaria bambusicola TaxID=326684 RepID=UPI002007E344|nr:terpenoid synthase [Xylaria bambusicola]KAI0520768.1 terpenoid synthase [Xylaria bambusicola]